MEGKLATAKIGGYYEADFLSAGTTSNNRQSNSYTWRTRQAFAQVTWDSGFQLTGGQMWSLATENRKGINNRQETSPLMIDPQYIVGYTWARQYAFRVVKDFGGKFALAMSIEGPRLLSADGFSTVTTINPRRPPPSSPPVLQLLRPETSSSTLLAQAAVSITPLTPTDTRSIRLRTSFSRPLPIPVSATMNCSGL